MPASDRAALAAVAAQVAEAVRSAGALALEASRKPLKTWVKETRFLPGLRGRHRGRRPAQGAAHRDRARCRLAVGGNRGRSGAALGAARVDRRPDRRHPRLHRRPRGLDHLGRARRGRPADRRGALCPGERGILSWRRRRRRHPQRASRSAPAPARDSRARGCRARSGSSTRSRQRRPTRCYVPRVHSLALRLARVADATLDVAFAGGASHDWDLAAADLLVHEAGGLLTTLEGATLSYNGAVPTHGTLVAAGRARHRALSRLLRPSDAPMRL